MMVANIEESFTITKSKGRGHTRQKYINGKALGRKVTSKDRDNRLV